MLLGHPVAHSLSPVIQNAALNAAGIALRYETLDVHPQALVSTFDELSAINCAGNVTRPHKRTAMGAMHAISDAAASAGTVNTFWSDQEGHLAGDNTDVAGFSALVAHTMNEPPSDCRISVLGAGGAAAAVLAAARAWKGCTVTVHGRNPERTAALCGQFSGFARATTMSDPAMSLADIVVNTTPIGLDDDTQPVDVGLMAADAVVIDLVYGKSETAWVRAARDHGHRASDGLPMLIRQGALSFRRWFGIDADEEAMWTAVLKATGRDGTRGARLPPQ